MHVRAAEETSVHEEILVAQSLLRCIRTADESIYLHHRSLCLDIHDIVGHICPQHILDAELEGLGRTEHKHVLAVVGQSESDVRARQGDPCELSHYMLELDRV